MSDKIKDKIEKLLNLSMSDNEHEAALALEKALKLMNKHNITKDEVYRQNFINKEIMTNNKRLPEWKAELYSAMANIAGCVFTWTNNFFWTGKVKAQITGRERDVENAIYLCEFLIREITKQEKEKKKELTQYGMKGSELSSYLKGFKKGIIKIVFAKLWEHQNKFFNEQKQEPGLVCIDLESKIKDSEDFLSGKIKPHKSKAKTDTRGEADGVMTGKEIELNQAVSKQDEIRQIGA
ncbi:hypothetical protein CRU96_05815 [Malaciobacter halophilus]|nr:DUF2786 domain-containing protein [Malaciobacter halophilus]RYA23924.1 hypothetical protein CRU96_05815 [Malaciobacter halophilus]